jgi:hypothetical protein
MRGQRARARHSGRSRPWLATWLVLAMLIVAGGVAWAVVSLQPGAPPRAEPVPPSLRRQNTAQPEPLQTAPVTGTRLFVSPGGSDDGDGSVSAPWRTLGTALDALQPGDLLTVDAGTYQEQLTDLSLRSGTRRHPIQVVAAPGTKPVLEGLLWLKDADHWSVRGLNVTWSPDNDDDQHMIKFDGGNDWSFSDAEVWGARSFAAILVTGNPKDWSLSRLFVHSTHPTHDTNQDHLIYVSSGDRGGVIQRCILADSPNGRAIKIGPPNSSSRDVGNVVVRYNTMFANLGPSNVQLSGGATGNRIYRNILVRSGNGQPNVSVFDLSGNDNEVYDNLGYASTGVLAKGVDGVTDKGGNVERDPGFADVAAGNFHPEERDARAYGRYAPTAR